MLIAGLIVIVAALVICGIWLVDLERRMVALEGARPRARSVSDAGDEPGERNAKP